MKQPPTEVGQVARVWLEVSPNAKECDHRKIACSRSGESCLKALGKLSVTGDAKSVHCWAPKQ